MERRPWPEERRNAVLVMLRQNLPYKIIAKRVGVKLAQLEYWLKERGLSRLKKITQQEAVAAVSEHGSVMAAGRALGVGNGRVRLLLKKAGIRPPGRTGRWQQQAAQTRLRKQREQSVQLGFPPVSDVERGILAALRQCPQLSLDYIKGMTDRKCSKKLQKRLASMEAKGLIRSKPTPVGLLWSNV
jgi:membrane glycosyltransferase